MQSGMTWGWLSRYVQKAAKRRRIQRSGMGWRVGSSVVKGGKAGAIQFVWSLHPAPKTHIDHEIPPALACQTSRAGQTAGQFGLSWSMTMRSLFRQSWESGRRVPTFVRSARLAPASTRAASRCSGREATKWRPGKAQSSRVSPQKVCRVSETGTFVGVKTWSADFIIWGLG